MQRLPLTPEESVRYAEGCLAFANALAQRADEPERTSLAQTIDLFCLHFGISTDAVGQRAIYDLVDCYAELDRRKEA